MDMFSNMLSSFLRGFIDSFRGFPQVFFIDREIQEREAQLHARISPKRTTTSDLRESTPTKDNKGNKQSIFRCMCTCFKWNGILVAGELLIYHLMIKIIFQDILNLNNPSTQSWGYYIEYFTILCYSSFFLMPVFAITKFINTLIYQDVSNLVHKASGRRSVSMGVSQTIADFIFSGIIEILFQQQARLMLLIPFWPIAISLYIAHRCLLFSLYAFEYKWFEYGWGLNKRLTFICMYWPYFIGFGLWLELITQISESIIISGGIFGILFPFLIISSFKSVPVTDGSPIAIPIFKPVIALTNFMFTCLNKNINKNQPSAAPLIRRQSTTPTRR